MNIYIYIINIYKYIYISKLMECTNCRINDIKGGGQNRACPEFIAVLMGNMGFQAFPKHRMK